MSLFLIVVALLLLVIIHSLFFTDKINYDVTADYEYNFNNAISVELSTVNNEIIFPEKNYISTETYLLKVSVYSHFLGKIIDPKIQIYNEFNQLHYTFERRGKGIRYIDISALLQGSSLSKAHIKCKACTLRKAHLLTFKELPSLEDSYFFVAPHSDDLELAAYGLYKNSQAHFVCVTAGEAAKPQHNLVKEVDYGNQRIDESIQAIKLAGFSADNLISLGYFDGTLEEMQKNPQGDISSVPHQNKTTKVYRERNTLILPSDGKANYSNLIKDFQFLLEHYEPSILVMPDKGLDTHPDHKACSFAMYEAIEKSSHKPKGVLSYVIHQDQSVRFPFGGHDDIISLVPNFNKDTTFDGVMSLPLPAKIITEKALALSYMSDLKKAPRFIRKVRMTLQAFFLRREKSRYGEHEYLRRFIRPNELFFYTKIKTQK